MWGAAETAQWLRGLAAKSWGPEFRSQRKYNQASPETLTLRQAETEGSLELSGCQPGQENVDSTFKERSYLKGRGSDQGRNLTLSSGHCNKHTGAYTVCTVKHTHAHTIKIKIFFKRYNLGFGEMGQCLEHLLRFQETWVWFLAPTLGDPWTPITPVPRNLMPSSGSKGTCTHRQGMHTWKAHRGTHIYLKIK